MLRDQIKAEQILAMKAGDKDRTAALRGILAKIKDRDIELRTKGPVADDNAMVIETIENGQATPRIDHHVRRWRAD